MQEYYDAMQEIGHQVMALLSKAMGLPSETLSSMASVRPLSLLVCCWCVHSSLLLVVLLLPQSLTIVAVIPHIIIHIIPHTIPHYVGEPLPTNTRIRGAADAWGM